MIMCNYIHTTYTLLDIRENIVIRHLSYGDDYREETVVGILWFCFSIRTIFVNLIKTNNQH